ncbi:hypothetical protein AKI39_21720 [Bordetella sp. H567]|uniref:hypothetical protein n=1 Tax=Bordetella sp. H567 TaxID=1697043 RepID=UPI00081C948A|nr:hypothetical protein [Bordetella sp. H567]AOB32792.1 hypothetical protein AKI39_21720 [Bordetella sp. H567]
MLQGRLKRGTGTIKRTRMRPIGKVGSRRHPWMGKRNDVCALSIRDLGGPSRFLQTSRNITLPEKLPGCRKMMHRHRSAGPSGIGLVKPPVAFYRGLRGA